MKKRRITYAHVNDLLALAKAVRAGDLRGSTAALAKVESLLPREGRQPRERVHKTSTPAAERLEMCKLIAAGGVSLETLCREHKINPTWFRKRVFEPYQRMGTLGVVPFHARPRAKRECSGDPELVLPVYEQWIADRAKKKPGRKSKAEPKPTIELSPGGELAKTLAPTLPAREVVFVCDYEEIE